MRSYPCAAPYMHSCCVASLFRHKSQFAQISAEALSEYTKAFCAFSKPFGTAFPMRHHATFVFWVLIFWINVDSILPRAS